MLEHNAKDWAAALEAAEPGEKVIPTFCAMCGPGLGCGIYAYVKNGRFMRVEGMRESPLNAGRICAKAHAAPQWVYSPQRLKYPLRRIGSKGEGRFERISWDQALDLIAARLKEQKQRYGAESLAILSPARRSYSEYLYRFLIAHGSPNYGHSGICAMQKAFSFTYTLGAAPVPDIPRSRLILIWGKQPVYSGSTRGNLSQILDAKERGARIVSIKPTMEPDVAISDLWIPIRPGTDAALALAMLNVIIGEKLYDAAFVSEWTYGFERLQRHIVKYTPQWAEPVTGIAADQIISLARDYAATKPASIDHGNGLEHAPSSNHAVRAIAILMAITGNLDRPGGDVFYGNPGMPMPKSVHLRERYTQEWVDKLLGPEFPKAFQPWAEGTSSAYYRIFDSVLTGKPYQVKTVIAPGTQPSVSTRGVGNVLEALKKLDFYVVIDVMRTAEMNYADVVIPVATMYETDHPFESGGNWVMARNRVIEPLGDYKSDYGFWIDLGVRMGYGKDFWNGSLSECMDEQLKPLNLTMEELRAKPTGIVYPPAQMEYEKYSKIFARPSTRFSKAPYLPQGKVAIYNTTFEENGFEPLPVWVEPPESPTGTPGLLKKYPLTFSDFHTSKVYNAGWLRNVPYLREVLPFPTLQIHPDTARERGIGQGDWVVVVSPHGKMKIKAEINPGIRPDTVMALHGWWQGCDELGLPGFPLLETGANTNAMYSVDFEKAFDPVVTAMSSQTLVQVTKA
ncbi:MAG: putative anaerobic dimethyl sulfoxide reductase, chain reductase precursor [Acidobacteria bacterium]|nr:putative anaerobic dimethyl sulfoxide reductase, chain reductase precursor [Acidobacteriota bacterium]